MFNPDMSAWLFLAGRLHPLVLHLPVALLLLGLLMEAASRFRRGAHLGTSVSFVLLFAALGATAAAASGWLLAAEGDYRGPMLERHRWLGIATAVLAWICYALSRVSYRPAAAKVYALSLLAAVGTMTAAAHFGGGLTHGEDFLASAIRGVMSPVAAAAPASAQAAPDDAQPVFAAVIQPSLGRHCVECHGPSKTKGDLRMDLAEHLLKGGKGGHTVVPGKSAESEIVRRVTLPRDDDEFMPPKGEPLSEDQVKLLAWWIDAGAPLDAKLADLPADVRPRADRIAAALAAAPVAAAPAAPKPVAAKKPAGPPPPVPEGLDGVIVLPIAQDEALLTVECVNAGAAFDNAALKRLEPLAGRIGWLDASRTGLQPGGLAPLAAFENLSRLWLGGTAVGDADLAPLAGLQKLEYLNLTGTAVTDAGVDAVSAIPSLRQVYLWGTQVTTQGVHRLRTARPGLAVETGAAAAPPPA